MPKPIYTFLRGTQLIHAKADLRYTLQKYNIFFILQVFLEQIQQSITHPTTAHWKPKRPSWHGFIARNAYFSNSKMVSGAIVISITAHMPAPMSFILAPSE